MNERTCAAAAASLIDLQQSAAKNLSQLEARRKEVILRNIRGEITNKEASMELMLSIQRICSIKRKYKAAGNLAFIHGNRCRKPAITKKPELKGKVLDLRELVLYGEKVFENSNYTQFAEIAQEEYNIQASRSKIISILKENGYKSTRRHSSRADAHFIRERKESFGEMVQADGTPFDWFGTGHKECIQGYVDDATGIPVGLYMTTNECNLGYIESARYMFEKHGIPKMMYTDKSSIFFATKKKIDERFSATPQYTQFGRMMRDAGVDMFPAHSPQAKGRIERFWETIQSRLPVEFKFRGIKTIEEANQYLPKFMEQYGRRFGVKAKSDEVSFVKVEQEQMQKLNELLTVRIMRKTNAAGVFSVMGYEFECRDCIRRMIEIRMSIQSGMYAITPDRKRHEIRLIEEDSSSYYMPEIWKKVIAEFFEKDAKAVLKEAN